MIKEEKKKSKANDRLAKQADNLNFLFFYIGKMYYSKRVE